MHLEVTFRNLNSRAEVTKRGQALFKKLHKFLDSASEGHLTVSVEHSQAIIELVITAHGQTYKTHEEHDELKAAIDLAFHRMETQLRRGKERRNERRARGGVDDLMGADSGEDEYEEV